MKRKFNIDSLHIYRYRHIYRLNKKCRFRMIKRGYMKKNISLGTSMDFDRAFMGYSSPYLGNVYEAKNK